MENASEALKMAFAVLVFVIAMSLGFMMISQARATADVVYATTDKQDYVDDITATTVTTDGAGNLITYRIVGLDTVIPTIYRYAQENYAVTIIEGNTIKARFDLQTESIVSSDYSATGSHGQNYLDLINGSVDAAGNTLVEGLSSRIFNATGINVTINDNIIKGLYKIEDVPNRPNAPWTSSPYNIMKRLRQDIFGGTEMAFNTNSDGTRINRYSGVFGTEGLIGKYDTEDFKEYYYTIKETNNLTEEEETKKLEIIYVVN